MKYIRILALLALFSFAIGFAGSVHPLFDSLSIGRPLAAIATLILAWSLWRPLNWILSGIMAIWIAIFAMTFLPSKPIESNFNLYQHNVLYTSKAPDLQLVADQLHPDVITLQEVKESRETIKTIEGYPYELTCEFKAVGDTSIISKYPFVKQGCATGGIRGFAWVQIEFRGSLITVVSLHLQWPYPYSQRKQIDEILPQLAALPRPVILGGDFNQTNWSYSARAVAKALDGKIENRTIPTIMGVLPIDHVISPYPMTVRKLGFYASDHNALLAKMKIE